jgi:hypothetical protein
MHSYSPPPPCKSCVPMQNAKGAPSSTKDAVPMQRSRGEGGTACNTPHAMELLRLYAHQRPEEGRESNPRSKAQLLRRYSIQTCTNIVVQAEWLAVVHVGAGQSHCSGTTNCVRPSRLGTQSLYTGHDTQHCPSARKKVIHFCVDGAGGGCTPKPH